MMTLLARSIVVALTVLAVVGCQNQAGQETDVAQEGATESAPDREATLAATVDALEEVWNSGDYDRLDTILAADVRRDGPDQDAEGIEAMRQFMEQVRTTYAPFQITFDDVAYGEDLAFVHWTVTGGSPVESGAESGAGVEQSGITLLRFDESGRITDEIVHFDTAALESQVGSEDLPHVE